MKKKVFIGISSIISMLIIVNIYVYINHQKVSEYVEESNLLRKKILILDEFRGDVVKASQFQKLYILTKKEPYKNDFDKTLNNIYKQIDEFNSNGYISEAEKSQLKYTIDDFQDLSSTYLKDESNYVISQDLEKQILKYNESQLKLLHEVTLDLASQGDNLDSKNSKIGLSSDLQTKLIQAVSSAITILVSGFAYYFKVKLKKDDIDIEDVISYLTKSDDEKKVQLPQEQNSLTNKQISTTPRELEELKNTITQNEILLYNANLLYKQSIKFQSHCIESEQILNEIDVYVKKLKVKLDDIQDYPTSAQKIILNDIENQLIEFKILFRSLPHYNEFIVDISSTMINKDK